MPYAITESSWRTVDHDEGLAPGEVFSVDIPEELAARLSSWQVSGSELEWCNSEMIRAQQIVTAIEYGEEGIPGTAQQWRNYWLALRKWTDTNPDFPDNSKRPVTPT